MTKKTYDYIQDCLKNLARHYRMPVNTVSIKSPAELITLMNDYTRHTGNDLDIRKDEKGKLHLFRRLSLHSDWMIYNIDFGLALKMREGLKEATQRFLSYFVNTFQIPFLSSTERFQMESDYLDERIEEIKDEVESDKSYSDYLQEELEKREWFYDYEKGQNSKEIERLKNLPPISKKELEEFHPENKKEEKLIKVLIDGYRFIDSKLDIWKYASPSYDEIVEDEDNGWYIMPDDILNAQSKDDGLLDWFIDSINESANSGCDQAEFLIYEEVKPTGKLHSEKLPTDFFKYIQKLDEALRKF